MANEYEKNCEDVLFECGRHCCICRRFRPTMLQVHHIIERQDGGGDEIDNLIAVCLTCHSDTHTTRPFARRFTPDELRRHRDRVYEMVNTGVLVAPNDDAIIPKDGLIQPPLSKEAIDVLIAAANSQDGYVTTIETFVGDYLVQVGGKSLVQSQSPRDRARFEHAIEELVTHGMLAANPRGGRITDKGFCLADELEAIAPR